MMVVIAIILALTAVLLPTGRALFQLNQRAAARQIAMLYERLHDEAVMRDRSFRITWMLDENRYVIEPGEAGALIAAGPEERERYEAEVKSKLALMDKDQKHDWMMKNRQPFEIIEAAGKMEVELPGGVRLGGIYTPQYGRMIRPGDKLEGMEKDDPLKVFSYVMNNGFIEHTLIWLVETSDPTDGWTVEVEPMSGSVKLIGELVNPEDAFAWLPQDPPTLPK
jgi:hypothetical protein